jgi:hypothetical protein
MSTSQTNEQNITSKLSVIRDEHQDDLTTTGNSNLNNSVECLRPDGLISDLDFNKEVAPSNRKLSAPNPQTSQLTLNQNIAGNRLRLSYIMRLGILPKCGNILPLNAKPEGS